MPYLFVVVTSVVITDKMMVILTFRTPECLSHLCPLNHLEIVANYQYGLLLVDRKAKWYSNIQVRTVYSLDCFNNSRQKTT